MKTAFARRAPGLVLGFPLLLAAWIFISAVASSEGDAGGLQLFFIGRRFSEIEPCGCVKNQLGGVQYEATLYSKADRASSIRVDTGGWSAGTIMPDTSMRTRYALRAMGGFLDLDAVNVGRMDLEHGKTFFKDMGDKHPEALRPLISANVFFREAPSDRAFPAYKIVDRTLPGGKKVRVGITGVSAQASPFQGTPQMRQPNTAKDYVITEPGEALKGVLAEMRPQADLLIALFMGTWPESVALAKANPDLDFIVTGIESPNRETKFVTEGKTRILSVHNSLGKELGHVTAVPAATGGNWDISGEVEWLPVSPKLPAAKQMVDLIGEFKKNTVELIVNPPNDAPRTYAAARSCAQCHMAEYKSWSETRHAHALDTLIAKGSQYDSKCLQCHTLGFQKDNGFYNVTQSRQLGDVQCENCHGPSLKHAEKENFIRNRSVDSLSPSAKESYLAEAKKLVPPKKVEAATCIQCHQGENDPHFDYAAKVHLVDHSGKTGG